MNSSDLFEAKKNLQTLYVSRKLTNAEDLVAWAHEQGFEKCLDPKEMHVTVAYSKEKIDVSEMTDSFDSVQVAAKKSGKGNKREMKLFGEKEDCVVLVFECPDLHHRWEEFIDDFGASWDHDGYHPHVTISYSGLPEGMKLEDITPYKGRLEFGPEIHQEINPKWKSKAKEKKTKPKKIDESKKTGSETDVRARKLMAEVTSFARRNEVAIRFRHPFRYAEGEIEITDLNANAPGNGAGTKVMHYLGQAADAEQLNIYVQPGDRRNAEFYERFGFERSPYGPMVRYPEMDPDDQEEFDAIRAQAGLHEGKAKVGKLEATPENLERASEFVLKKWRERAAERGYPEPEDLSSSCKFSSMFAQAVFGGQIQGHYEHQYVVLNGEIIDLNKDAADVKAMDDPHDHDESWFGNAEHLDSMESCKPRVMDWVREFTAGLNESFTLNSLDDSGVDRLVATFRNSYEAQTGSSWAEDKLLSRASNWTFYGDENGYLAVRKQASGMKKMVAVAGDPKSVLKGMAELQAEGGPIWGAVSGELANVAKKRGMIVPHMIPGGALLIKTLAKSIPASVFGGVEPKVTDNGGIVLDYDDTGSTTKYFVGNKEYFQSALKLPMVASQLASIPGLKPVIKMLGLTEAAEPSKLYHGTSTGQFNKLREGDYEAVNLSLTETVCEHDALLAAAKDGTDPLIMEIDANKLVGALGLNESEGGGYLYNGSLREGVLSYYPFQGSDPLTLSESVSSNWPTVSFEELFHVGTMNPAHKQPGSLEGAGLSVSRHPESWMQIARGQVNGEVWKLTKPGNQFLHFHKLNPEQRQVLTNWGIQHRFVEGGETFVLPYYDEDFEEDREMEFDDQQSAEEEAAYLGLDPATIKHVRNTLKVTPKLLSVTNKGNGDALQLLATVYVEAMLPFDGVWWADEFDPDRLSAPRGVIIRSKVTEWTAEKDPHAEDADDGDFD